MGRWFANSVGRAKVSSREGAMWTVGLGKGAEVADTWGEAKRGKIRRGWDIGSALRGPRGTGLWAFTLVEVGREWRRGPSLRSG